MRAMIQPDNDKSNAWPMFLADVQFGKVLPLSVIRLMAGRGDHIAISLKHKTCGDSKTFKRPE